MTSPTERPTPTPVLATVCPDMNTLDIGQFAEADPECFAGDIMLRGWLDRPPALGFEGPLVKPEWLYYPAENFASLWSEQPVDGEDRQCPPASADCAWIFLHLAPGSDVELGGFGRWIEVVGHVHDPAASTCRYTYPDPESNPWGSPPDSDAVASCLESFVVTEAADLAHD